MIGTTDDLVNFIFSQSAFLPGIERDIISTYTFTAYHRIIPIYVVPECNVFHYSLRRETLNTQIITDARRVLVFHPWLSILVPSVNSSTRSIFVYPQSIQ